MTEGHGHDHHRTFASGRSFFCAIILNSIYVIIELISGYLAGSVALIGDAVHNFGDAVHNFGDVVHNFGDVVGLLVAWAGGRLSQTAPNKAFSYGLKRSSILAALVADALVSVGVVLSGLVIYKTGWNWVDPAVSLLIAAVILKGTWGLLREASRMILDGVPLSLELTEVENWLKTQTGIVAIDDIHIWNLGTIRFWQHTASAKKKSPSAEANGRYRLYVTIQGVFDGSIFFLSMELQRELACCFVEEN